MKQINNIAWLNHILKTGQNGKLIMRIKINKSPEENYIAADLLKNVGEPIRNEIWKMIKVIWKIDIIPEEWNTAMYNIQ